MPFASKITDAGDTYPGTSIVVTFSCMVPDPTGTPQPTTIVKVCRRTPWLDKYNRGEFDRGNNPDYEPMPADTFVAVKQSGGQTSPGFASRQNFVQIYGGCYETSTPADPQNEFTTDGDPTPDIINVDPVPGPDFESFNFSAPAFSGTTLDITIQAMASWYTGTGQPLVEEYWDDPPRPLDDPPFFGTGFHEEIPADPYVYTSDYVGKCRGTGGPEVVAWDTELDYPAEFTAPDAIEVTNLVTTAGSATVSFDSSTPNPLTDAMYIGHEAFPNGQAKILSATATSATLSQPAWKSATGGFVTFGYWGNRVRIQGFNGTCNERFPARTVRVVTNAQTRTRSRIVTCDAPGPAFAIGEYSDASILDPAISPNPVTRVLNARTFETARAMENNVSGANLGHCAFTEGSDIVVCDDTAGLRALVESLDGNDDPIYAPLDESEFILEGIPIRSGVTGERVPEFQIAAIVSPTSVRLTAPAGRSFTAENVLILLPFTAATADSYILGTEIQTGEDPGLPAATGKPHGTIDIGAPSDPGTPPAFLAQVS